MYAPRVFLSMIVVLVVFAGATFVLTGSLATAVLQTVLSAIILQVGYFIGVLYLVRREKKLRKGEDSGGELHGDAPAKLKVTDR